MLPELITGSLATHPSRSFADYEPVQATVPRRIAVYSANLVILLVLVTGKVSASEFTGPNDSGRRWPQYAYLWRSGLRSAEWDRLIDTVRAEVGYSCEQFDITLTLEDGPPVSRSTAWSPLAVGLT